MKKHVFILCMCAFPAIITAQVTIEKGATVFLGKNAELDVEGDFAAKENIHGEGMLVLSGTTAQAIDLQGNNLPGLVVDNKQYVALLSPLAIRQALVLKTGHLQLGQHNL